MFAICLRRRIAGPVEDDRVRQQGPADAVAGGQDRHIHGSESAGMDSYEGRVARAAVIFAILRVWLGDQEVDSRSLSKMS